MTASRCGSPSRTDRWSISCLLDRPVTAEQVNDAFAAAADEGLRGVTRYTTDPIISRDIIGQAASCVFGSSLTQADAELVKVFGWYDNEWGLTNRLADLIEYMATRTAEVIRARSAAVDVSGIDLRSRRTSARIRGPFGADGVFGQMRCPHVSFGRGRGTEDPDHMRLWGGCWKGTSEGAIMHTKSAQCVLGDLGRAVESVIFGVDGVIVDSARASAAAWESVFDPFLRSFAAVRETAYVPFDVRADYQRYVHGKPRLEGTRDFLVSREITLPYDDLRGLAARHEECFLGEVRWRGVSPFAATIVFVRKLRRHGVRTAVVSEHCHGSELLTRARVAGMFDVLLDGLDAPGTALPTHPDTGLLVEAALRLGTPPERTAVIEGTDAGAAAARHGGFGVVIGVDPSGGSAGLGAHGADLVIADTSELRLRLL